MIVLLPTRLHWINDDGADDPLDLCAHSPVQFEVDNQVLVGPEAGDFAVSAAAIHLLRTLDRDHKPASLVGEQLFPCCGHAMYDTGSEDVLFCGCPNGSNVYVTHEENDTIRLTTHSGQSHLVSFGDWLGAVNQFSDCVHAFYEASLPKAPGREDAAGFAKMWLEWDRRRNQTASRRAVGKTSS